MGKPTNQGVNQLKNQRTHQAIAEVGVVWLLILLAVCAFVIFYPMVVLAATSNLVSVSLFGYNSQIVNLYHTVSVTCQRPIIGCYQ